MAHEPAQLTYPELPADVERVLATLIDAGHEAVLVGGAVRDHLLGLPHGTWDWDAATSASPEEVAALFADSAWENRFGTVTVRGLPPVEVTSFRAEGGYRDARRPDEVRFGVSLAEDLGRRDFTINAIAWIPIDLAARRGRLVDPTGGVADLRRRILRTVGDPRARFGEDALRLIRAARLAARFDLSLEPETEAAVRELAPTVAGVSGERIRDELSRILGIPDAPSRGLAMLERLGLLAVILPEVAALRGIPQAKAVPGDALDHTFAAVDAVPPDAPGDTRLAALLHDIGKATTLADGHFFGHEEVGARLARRVLDRLHVARSRVDRIAAVIEHHMYAYEPAWTDAAVRRFIRRLDTIDRELLFALRRADDRASGVAEEGERHQRELERRIDAELEQQPELLIGRRLAVDGHDLQAELGLPPGPSVGALLDRLMESVLDDPGRNQRATLLALAREMAGQR
ncbi:MAG TPA: CCA tRNA nucleotidyltransferase [Candidatus Limnocylindria bacterium]